ncbi:MAG: ABC transporter ATP-binding protein [Acetobacteraceae bacterium]|nr:ABC transporter ATP-binding protein [Acetobacteraceae bacterium]
MLEVELLRAGYGPVEVVCGVSLRVGTGETVALVGSNGAGKSTLLRAVAGLVPLIGGTISFEGQRLDGLPPHRRLEMGLGYVPEGHPVFPFMTVQENLELGAMAPRARAHRRRNLDRVMELFPVLGRRRRALAGTLSGGEQRMLAIARGLVGEPRLLLLDEPSFGLAPLVLARIYRCLAEVGPSGVGLLLAEQHVARALSLARRGYVLSQGRVVLEGGSEELLGHPQVRRAYLGL